jgi:hypothetical protein
MYKMASSVMSFELRGETVTPSKTFEDSNGKKAQLVKIDDTIALYLEGLDGNYKPTSFWPKEILKALINKQT